MLVFGSVDHLRIRFLHLMTSAFDVSPNAFSFGSVISACEKAGASAINKYRWRICEWRGELVLAGVRVKPAKCVTFCKGTIMKCKLSKFHVSTAPCVIWVLEQFFFWWINFKLHPSGPSIIWKLMLKTEGRSWAELCTVGLFVQRDLTWISEPWN